MVKACDLGYVIRDKITLLMQIFDKELADYRMQMMTTKCLNTAVLIMYMFLAEGALVHTAYCDVPAVKLRYSKANMSVPECNRFKTKLLDVSDKDRQLFYVMITDGKAKNHTSSLDFPGHVCVIEKTPATKPNGLPRFFMYQSYIRSYRFHEHVAMNDGDIELSYPAIVEYANCVQTMFVGGVWTRETTLFWQKYVHVDESDYEGYTFAGHIHFCYRAVPINTCAQRLIKKLENKLDDIRSTPGRARQKMFDVDIGMFFNKADGDAQLEIQEVTEQVEDLVNSLVGIPINKD